MSTWARITATRTSHHGPPRAAAMARPARTCVVTHMAPPAYGKAGEAASDARGLRRSAAPRRDLLLDEPDHVGHGCRDLRCERVRVGAHVADLDGEDHDLGVGAGQARMGHQVGDAHAVDVVGTQRHDADVVGAEAEDLTRTRALTGGIEGVDDDDHVGLAEVPYQREPRRLSDDDVGIVSLRSNNIHGMGVPHLVAHARLTGADPEVVVFAVQVRDVRPNPDTLTPEVAAAVPDVIGLIKEEIA